MATQILAPLDGSALAEQALSCAVTLAQGLLSDLVLFRAVSIPLDFEDIMADVLSRDSAINPRIKLNPKDGVT
jgi:hypothetical protein